MDFKCGAWIVIVGGPLLFACGSGGSSPAGSSGSSGGSGSSGSSSGGGSGGSGGSSGGSGSGSGGSTGDDGGTKVGGDGAVIPAQKGVEVYQTSRSAGANGAPDHVKDVGSLTVGGAPASGVTTITVDATMTRQTIEGWGAALTEAVASVVTGLSTAQQQEILSAYYGPNGSRYTLARTHIGSCDFALSQYSYDDSTSPDPSLSKFSIAHDQTLLLPFLKSAIAASGGTLKILSSPWSAPGWMKDNGMMQGSNNSDGSLLPQYYGAYASYLSKYLQAYKAAGVNVWAITPQNEALGVGGSREGMQWSAAQMDNFIRANLGPQLKTDGFGSLPVFIYDHNKGPAGSDMVNWATTIFHDAVANPFVAGTAVHWYGATVETYNDGLDALHAVDPTKTILFDEGTADELGDVAFGKSSAAFQYSWMKDDFYWKKDDWDWGFWFAMPVGGHIVYEPAYRYIRDIINGLNHWYTGFIDWNAVLNKDGGPSHISNPVPATVMVDTAAKTIYYSPTFYAMQHFSKFIRPQAKVLATTVAVASGVKATDYDGTPTQDGNALIAAAAQNSDGSTAIEIFNETSSPIDYAVVLGTASVAHTIPAQSIQTVVWTP